ncbi:MAG: hypothetical protein JMDDDDMK_02812 [Acidobacteria bacterium]|nr:hypothetical protein [Acidobacteriota bacterium]
MAFYTIVIAVVASLGEILSKNQSKTIRDIFNAYLIAYLAINGFFAYVTYQFLPAISAYILKPEYASWAQHESWGRVFIAAFGYLVIVRAKFITINDTPIGVDTLYDAFSKYCLTHLRTAIDNRQDQILNEIYNKFPRLDLYEEALQIRLPNLAADEQKTIEAEIARIKGLNKTDHIKCKMMGILLLRIVGTQDAMIKTLQSIPASAADANKQP